MPAGPGGEEGRATEVVGSWWQLHGEFAGDPSAASPSAHPLLSSFLCPGRMPACLLQLLHKLGRVLRRQLQDFSQDAGICCCLVELCHLRGQVRAAAADRPQPGPVGRCNQARWRKVLQQSHSTEQRSTAQSLQVCSPEGKSCRCPSHGSHALCVVTNVRTLDRPSFWHSFSSSESSTSFNATVGSRDWAGAAAGVAAAAGEACIAVTPVTRL